MYFQFYSTHNDLKPADQTMKIIKLIMTIDDAYRVTCGLFIMSQVINYYLSDNLTAVLYNNSVPVAISSYVENSLGS